MLSKRYLVLMKYSEPPTNTLDLHKRVIPDKNSFIEVFSQLLDNRLKIQ